MVRRNRVFVIMPWIILAAACLLLGWEIVRQNLPKDMLEKWPWRFQILDLESGSTIATVVAVLIFTRMQYAQTMRPAIGFRARPIGESNELDLRNLDNVAWNITVHNRGTGIATVDRIEYLIAAEERSVAKSIEWMAYDEARLALQRFGLVEFKDYRLHRLSQGYPLTAADIVDSPILTITTAAMIDALGVFDVRLRIQDALGDHHEIFLPFRETFPVHPDRWNKGRA